MAILLFFNVTRFQGERKGHYTVVFLGVFFVGRFGVVCVNMAGNVDINMPGIKIL
jgi:hypothetical protein